MAPPARDLSSDLRQHHGVETPEHVDVRFELAGVGSRLAAALLDVILISLIGICIRLVFGFVIDLDVPAVSKWVTALLVLLSFILSWGYFVLFEALNGGRTPGKQALGIRVVMDTGRPVTFGAAVIRNLTKPWAILLAPLLVGMVSMFIDRSNKRLGDMAAGTIVVRDHPTVWSIGAEPVAAEVAEPIETGPPELTEEEFRLLDRFLSRVNELAPEVRNRIAANLAQRFEGRIPRRTQDTQGYLAEVFNAEQRKRRSRFAVRAQPGAAGRTTVTGERFLARKREAWETFRKVALRMEASGVGALAPREIPGFAAQYREVAADLARARTYQVDPRVIEYLERVVSAGHNALYRARGKARTPVHWYILRDFPAAVVQSAPYVLVAFLLFAVPAAAGYAILRERPSLAEEVMPGVMISRAEQAAERQAEGRGYAQQGEYARPRVAAMIITNNIQVSFLAFVGGLTGGLLTAWVLLSNGLSLGFAFGLFRNYGALSYLTTFVAGHGVLELTAIFISAGAGFRMAKGLIAPGDRARKDALVMEGRIAVRMIGAVVTLLAIAGTIEGLLSTSDAPAAVKYGVSAATVVLLVLYLANGYRELRAPSP
ncbi:MAG TPA: stage II sporulation protein M [Gemmatimonadales bacterium]|nr:stage II sporulation protein M [Gemmatimonadales bacterium]